MFVFGLVVFFSTNIKITLFALADVCIDCCPVFYFDNPYYKLLSEYI